MLIKTMLRRRARSAWLILRAGILFIIALLFLNGSAVSTGGITSQARSFTRGIEFEFGAWTLDAITTKFSHWSLNLHRFLSPADQSRLVLEYLDQLRRVQVLNAEVTVLVGDPSPDLWDETGHLFHEELVRETARLEALGPLAESILQSQLMDIVHEAGLSVLGQVIPPSLYRASDVPQSLILSPRTEIVQALDISLLPGQTAEVMEQLEESIFQALDHSALVVPIGGIGTYPTMVMQTADLVWLTEVIAHEWVHNYLILRPLGMNYFTSPELRTINETTASLAGKELGRMILEKYYPDHLPPDPDSPHADTMPVNPDVDVFDFRAEMRQTRERVDELLSRGEVEQAESYMESRRVFFWEKGYPIRKINQAYFAFYGAYNDEPGGGASGDDLVGPAVTAFRAQFETLAEFIRSIAWIDSYEKLLAQFP